MFKSGFDSVAPFYDNLAAVVFGNTLKEAQQFFLNHIPPAADILIIGGGSGWLLQECCIKLPQSRIVYIEASAEMLRLSQRRLAGMAPASIVEFRLGTEQSIGPEEKFDAIITPFMLDLFPPPELKEICKILFKSLRPDGWWLVTDFVQPSGTGLGLLGRKLLLKSMYYFFRLFCNIKASALPDWEYSLQAFNLNPQESAYFYQGMVKSVVYQKLNN